MPHVCDMKQLFDKPMRCCCLENFLTTRYNFKELFNFMKNTVRYAAFQFQCSDIMTINYYLIMLPFFGQLKFYYFQRASASHYAVLLLTFSDNENETTG